jgi:hypothetical protein
VVYVATAHNTVYAFDADDTSTSPSGGHLIAPRTLRTAPLNTGCSETMGPIGITGTPVIDKTAGVMYVAAMGTDGYWLHKLSLSTLADVTPPQWITANLPGDNGTVWFDANVQRQRPGLLLMNGIVYLGFGTRICDAGDYHGWVLAYNSSLNQVGAWVSTPHNAAGGAASQGGIWQSGAGLAGDDSGNIYFATGNGTQGGNNYGNAFVRLAPNLGAANVLQATTPATYMPTDSDRMNSGDVDLGSGGMLVLPSGRVLGGGKSGEVFLMDQGSLGIRDHFQAYYNEWHNNWWGKNATTITSDYWGCNYDPNCYINVSDYDRYEVAGPNIHGNLVYWQPSTVSDTGYIYGMPEKEYLKAYAYHPSTGYVDHSWAWNNYSNRWEQQPAMKSTSEATPNGMPGAALSISAWGGNHGIVWASYPKVDTMWTAQVGRLVAYDALTMAELWRDDDDVAFAKFNPPLVAAGKVYRATFGNELIVYGHKSTGPDSSDPCYTIDQKYQNYGGAEASLGNATTGENLCPDGVGYYQHYVGNNGAPGNQAWGAVSIYWTPSTCAHEIHGAIRGKWSSMGWEKSALGYPTTDERATPDQYGRYNHFQVGSIYWTPRTGAFEVQGLIHDHWASLGWERSFLGYPVTDETTTPDGIGRYNHFEGGSIYWTPSTGAWSIHGLIRDHWASMGWERSVLGYPVTDETGTPDGVGRYNHFQNDGSIYWTPSTGAWEVHGPIRDKWASMGWEQGALGYPISDVQALSLGFWTYYKSQFQHGSLTYYPWTGQVVQGP